MYKILIAFVLSVGFLQAQRNFTIDETVYGPRTYAAKTLPMVQWQKGTQALTYLDDTYQKLMVKDVKTLTEKTLVYKSELEKAINEKLQISSATLRIFPYDFSWISANVLSFQTLQQSKNYIFHFDIITKSIIKSIEIPSQEVAGLDVNSQDYASYLEGNNIQLVTPKGERISVTNDENKAIVNGSDYVHRQEFGINKGMFWSPKGNKLAYYRKDETMVGDYPIIDWNEREAKNNNIKYPMAGMKSEEVTLVVYDVNSAQKVSIQTGEPKEQYLTMITWDPSGEFIYIGVLNREQNHLKLNQYNVTTGSFVKTLFEEKSNSWVEPQHPLLFIPNNPKQFIYQTDSKGYNQMYVYDTNGKLVKNLGYNDVVVQDIKGFSTKNDKITYLGTANNGLDSQLYEVELKSGKTKQLTSVSGIHSASISDDGTYILDQYSNATTPNSISIVQRNSGKSSNLISAENPLAGKINTPKIELLTLTSADGKTPLNARIIYPANFDATQKYPVMVYVYGGSHAQLVTNRWLSGAGYFDMYMAQQGYIVFTLDNRGSDNRGKAFCEVTHRNLGVNEMADQMKGIEFLKSKNFVDEDRIGVFGWSYGGFMTISLMLNQPETFKTGVAGGPVIDWKYYEIMYGERYMDTPQENPDGYKNTSLLEKASKLQGELLIIHGAQDPVVVQQHSMNFIEACIKSGKQVDYFLYPNHEHNVGGKDRIHLYQKVASYFDLHLKK